MGNPAYARTDEHGRHVDGFSFKMVENLTKDRPSPWHVSIQTQDGYRLGDLLGINRYHVLATYLTYQVGYPASKSVRAGFNGLTRSIIIDGKEYRGNGYKVYQRRRNQEKT